ncbi:quinate permease [Cenococcum geophilum 1.58]|uniref:quinate permease n=1 Tax=Cenococcum geophilum 1.58 TaxID=794803 RepID=UPI00358F85D6|nr:quinate permease [Cenococcum geophilum 1.58]
MAPNFFKNRRVYLLATVAYMGSLLFASRKTSICRLALQALPAPKMHVSSNVVSLLTAGCFFGAIAAAFLNERFGRRYSLMFFAVIFLIGAAVQTAAHHEIGMIYAGRIIAGLGVGGMSSITPVFVSENCPPNVRGRIAGLFQEFLVIGSTFAYWLDYGVSLCIPVSTKQWRVPVAIQLIPGGLMLFGLLFLKESPRWLMKKGRHHEAAESLAHIRCETTDSPDVAKELAEIRAAIEEELNATEGATWKECLLPGNRYRFLTGFALMFWQQFSGTNSIGYYAPQIFQTVGLSKALHPCLQLASTAQSRFGRKKSLIFGALWMSGMMFIIGAVLATHPPNNLGSVSHASIAMVVMIYLYVIGYAASWGPVPWVYLSEIFPTRLRAYGVGMGAATQWLFNFVITKITPEAVNHIKWRTFLMFAIFCLGMCVFAFFFIKETKGRSLEDMDILFGAVNAEQRAEDVERVLASEKGAVQMDESSVDMTRRKS